MPEVNDPTLHYAPVITQDVDRQAWRTVARIVETACLCYGLYWIIHVAGNLIYGFTLFARWWTREDYSMWETIQLTIMPWAHIITTTSLMAGAIGMMLRQSAMRYLLLWACGVLALLLLASGVMAAVDWHHQYVAAGWISPEWEQSGDYWHGIAEMSLSKVIPPIIFLGLVIAIFTRPPLVAALKPA